MSAYLIVDITVHDPDRYQDYVRQVADFIAKHQGSYLVRGGEAQVMEGDWQPRRLVILKFPDRGHARAFLEDPAYQAVAAIRHAAATTHAVLVDGYTENGP